MSHSAIEREIINRLRGHVEHLAGLIGPRHEGRPASLEAAIAVIDREFSSFGYTTTHQTYPVGSIQAVNIVAELKGLARPDEIVILGAHYDTVKDTPGADDNASAVAVLIESARLLVGRRFARTIRYVAFACEEPPHFYTDTMGSAVHARQCRLSHENIVGLLCLEMVGYYRDEPGSQALPPGIPRVLSPLFPRRGNFLAAVGNLRSWKLCWNLRTGFKRAVRFPLYSIVLPERVNAIRLSDNGSFWDQGYPALMLTDTSFLRNPHYHQPTDTPDTLDYERMAKVAIGVAGALAHIAIVD